MRVLPRIVDKLQAGGFVRAQMRVSFLLELKPENELDTRRLITKTLRRNALFVQALLACSFMIGLAEAFSQTSFYQDKTITLVVSIAPGGSGDIRIKSLLPFLRKHIPGNPEVIDLLKNIAGGGPLVKGWTVNEGRAALFAEMMAQVV